MASEEDDYCQDKAEEAAATDRWKPYKILKKEDIKLFQENDISAVSGVLSVPRGVACSLLCRNKWCLTSAYEFWFDDGERNPNPTVNSAKQQICNICTLPKEVVSAACGHPFCADCWKTYIAAAVSDGAGCLMLQCPEPGCRAAVTSDMVEKLASEADWGRYEEYLRRSYVESSRSRKWCPSAGCERAVEFEVEVGSESYDVVCDCSHKFCWRCGEEWHRPVDCEAAVEWLKRNRSEGANTMWILVHTKPCPRCGSPVERGDNGYVLTNCMTCTPPCSFEFCWKCLSPWIGDENGRCFCCEKMVLRMYEEERRRLMQPKANEYKKEGGKSSEEEDTRRMRAKRYRERYIHCYERWDANDKLRKMATEDLERVRKRYVKIEQMQFVVEAWEQIVEGRHVLKWSYVYGYYLAEEGGKATFLEHLQAHAEEALERLQHCVEKQIIREEGDNSKELEEFRAKVVCRLISVRRKYFENLLRALENDLAEVDNYLVMEKNDIADHEVGNLAMTLEKNEIAEVANDLAKEIEDFVIACEKNEIAEVENYLAKEIEDLVMALEMKNDIAHEVPILVKKKEKKKKKKKKKKEEEEEEKEKPAVRSSMNDKLKLE